MKMNYEFACFSHKWETVVQAAWRKYPNPFNPAVIGTDVVERKVENGILKSHRLMSTCWGIPGWAKRVSWLYWWWPELPAFVLAYNLQFIFFSLNLLFLKKKEILTAFLSFLAFIYLYQNNFK